jgi:hypothetical protein
MFHNIPNFDWNHHTDTFQDEWHWPENNLDLPVEHTTHSDQWMLGFMGKFFTERIVKILTNCQPYPGDDGSLELTATSQ